MHDPQTVAFDIKRPWPHRNRSAFGGKWHWPTLITIWHVDPERDHTDDSCGWFPRARHGNPKALDAVRKEFAFHWDRDRTCWFSDKTGLPNMGRTSIGIVLEMFEKAALAHYRTDGTRWQKRGHAWKSARAFMQRNLYDILHFAENGMDSLHSGIHQVYGLSEDKREERLASMAGCVYAWILRAERPWYRHPRWHVWHWKIQVHPTQAFKRWAFSKCAGCGRGFAWGYAPTTYQWDSDGPRWFVSEQGVYHSECSGSGVAAAALDPQVGVTRG
jgi:hypothetical protein